MVIKIEKGVKLRRPFNDGTVSSAVFKALSKMQVGDSFVIDNAHYITFNFLRHMDDFNGKIFIGRKEDDKNKRIWRSK